MCGGCLIRFGYSVYVSSLWLSRINTGVRVCARLCVCVRVRVCVRACVRARARCDMSTHPFIIYVILYLYYRFLCGITCLCCCKRKCFGVPLQALKLMSLILVKLNCPVGDD